MKYISQEALRFLVWGVANTALSTLVYYLLVLFLPYGLAYSLAYAGGVYLNYFTNSRFVFQTRLSLGKAFSYPLVYGVQYLISLVLLELFVRGLEVSIWLAPWLVVVARWPLSYLMNRLVIKNAP